MFNIHPSNTSRTGRRAATIAQTIGLSLVVFILTILLSASPAAAQVGGPSLGSPPGGGSSSNSAPVTAAPQPATQKSYPVWVGYVVIALMTGAIMGVSLMPSKRSHQD